MAEVVFPWVEVGLLDRASLQVVGVLPVEDLMSGGLILGPKLQLLRKDRVQAAGGVLHAVGSLDSGGLLYGVVTIGGPDAGLTVGVGHGYGGLVDSGGSPDMVFVGGDAVVGKGLRLMAEVYLGGEGLGLPELTLIGGLRWSRGRFSLDLGCVVPVYETGAGTPFPVLSLGLAF